MESCAGAWLRAKGKFSAENYSVSRKKCLFIYLAAFFPRGALATDLTSFLSAFAFFPRTSLPL
jgi:hypothetical protein